MKIEAKEKRENVKAGDYYYCQRCKRVTQARVDHPVECTKCRSPRWDRERIHGNDK